MTLPCSLFRKLRDSLASLPGHRHQPPGGGVVCLRHPDDLHRRNAGNHPQERLDRLAACDLDAVRLSPAQAAELAGMDPELGFDGRVTLLTVMDRPAYRFGGSTTVFADTGQM